MKGQLGQGFDEVLTFLMSVRLLGRSLVIEFSAASQQLLGGYMVVHNMTVNL